MIFNYKGKPAEFGKNRTVSTADGCQSARDSKQSFLSIAFSIHMSLSAIASRAWTKF
ncbi:hypothetical protein ALO80_200076 [Pseudomonas caricapapayae]|uniref:Uncharacterized protein n=1 Tax=Pseudomonas caricapapayae TaxID=46678 RepID=A0A0P9KYS0_9PSED|nr:hypothetical protein ALO80_200076 [Pseudomonas caricapapayae]RMM10120.1 hypothetical protein ALQ84_200091 [Pseudomonas caricapapayae]